MRTVKVFSLWSSDLCVCVCRRAQGERPCRLTLPPLVIRDCSRVPREASQAPRPRSHRSCLLSLQASFACPGHSCECSHYISLFVRVSNVSVFVCFQTRHKASWWESRTWWWSINSGYCSAVAVTETQGAATRFWSSSSCPLMYVTLKVLAPEARWLRSIWSFGILRIFGFWPCDSLKALEMILNLLIYFKTIAFQVFRKLLLINSLKPSSGSQSANFLGVP